MLSTLLLLESGTTKEKIADPIQNDIVQLQNPRWRRRIKEAIDYIHEHFANRISQESLSLEVNIPVPKLQAGIKQFTGFTLGCYHEQVKIKAAKSLLEMSDLPLKLIAKKVGFKTHSHFGDAFKKITGMTPSQYRNQHGQ
jgi:two-component system, response regulator YesN